ncbi:MAG TPA: hypothetical protein VL334_08830, partial [Anaerolineae bacterium]|nr:hypothetical protein [Anaerolineae bacterium]
MFPKKFAVLALVLSAGPAAAQDWEFGLSLYAWTPDTRADIATPLGEVSGALSFSEAWDALDFAFMGTVSAQRGRLSLLLDSFYFDLSDGRVLIVTEN